MPSISPKVLAQAAVAILAAVLSVLQIIDWFGRPSTRLEAGVSFGSIDLPPDVIADYETLKKLSEGEWIESIPFGKLNKSGTSADDQLAATVLVGLVKDSLRKQSIRKYSGAEAMDFWKATVKNTGSQSLSQVRLLLPGSYAAKIVRTGTPNAIQSIDSVIEVGAIQPQEEVEIIAWTKALPIKYFTDDVRLTHSTGVGNIEFLSEFGAIARFVQRNDLAVFLGLISVSFILFAAVLIYIALFVEKYNGKNRAQSE